MSASSITDGRVGTGRGGLNESASAPAGMGQSSMDRPPRTERGHSMPAVRWRGARGLMEEETYPLF